MRLFVDASTLYVTGLLLIFIVSGCATTEKTTSDENTITVEGMVTARGNEPFSAYVLETDSRNFYVLNLEEADRGGFSTPARIRATGSLYLTNWMGRPFTHLRVSTWVMVDR